MLRDMSNESHTDRMERLVTLLIKKALCFIEKQPKWYELPKWEPIVSVYDSHIGDNEARFDFFVFYHEEMGIYYLRPACTYSGNITVLLTGYQMKCLTTDLYFVKSLIKGFDACKDFVETARRSEYEYFYYGGGIHVYKNLNSNNRAMFEVSIEEEWYKKFDIDRCRFRHLVMSMLSSILMNSDNEKIAEKIGDHFTGSVYTRLFSGHTFGIRVMGEGESDGTFRPFYKTRDNRFFEMLICSNRDVPYEDNDTFVNNLCDYYVYMIALESGLVEPEWTVKEFSENELRRGLMGYKKFIKDLT